MTSIAVLLHENVIEELNLSYLSRRRKKAEEKDDEKEKNETSKEEEETKQTGDKEQQTDATEEKTSDATVGETGTSDDEAHGEEVSPDDAGTSDQEQESNDDGGDGSPTEHDNKPEEKDEEQEEENEHQRVWNTSLKTLAMAGNNLDDEYLESLLGIFSPPLRKKARSSGAGTDRQLQQQPCSALEELTLLGNRFSNHGIKRLLKALPQFPYLQRLYLGYQQPPPRFGPPATSVLSMGDASIIPELADRNTQFSPGSLRYEFLEAVSDNPSNFNLTEVNTLGRTGADEALGGIMRFYAKLNAGGRRLLATHALRESATTDAGAQKDNGRGDDGATKGVPGDFDVPLGLWPLVLDRANRLHPLPSPGRVGDDDGDAPDNLFHAGDVVYSLLHGPMVFENLDNSRITNSSSSSSSSNSNKTKPRNIE
mmetsp:Transcript_22337/g.49533  ORF Transcript_22337/g.49533 Transcript_22337/m.49533 type:complete len:425 (+) Transcript_22337:435-1709(+)